LLDALIQMGPCSYLFLQSVFGFHISGALSLLGVALIPTAAMPTALPAFYISRPILSWLFGQDRIIKISG